jgi:hypothetical protein
MRQPKDSMLFGESMADINTEFESVAETAGVADPEG